MLTKEDFAMLKALATRGVYHKDIAAQLGVHPKTVSRALQRGTAPAGTRPPRGSKLDPFKAQIDQLLADGIWNSVVILRRLQAAGYTGSSTILREYIAPKRLLRPGRATVRFETPPGQQLQSDWGEIVTVVAGQPTKVHFIVNELSYSRRFHFWCAAHSDAEHTYEGLIRAFEYFGGVPQQVLVDNQKAAVLLHRGAEVQFNPRFLDLAAHYGFAVRACRPYRARTKGKDERMVGYVKHHFFVRYPSFASWAELNTQAEQWLREEADQRVQTTVHEVVAARFAREAPQLQPLAATRYDTAYLAHRHVSWDSYIHVRGNRYSVPADLVGQMVLIRIGLDGHLRVFADDRLVVRRYERASLIVTSNKSFLDWGEVFNDGVLATAILDRLLHHATTLNIKGESYRLKEKRRAGMLSPQRGSADGIQEGGTGEHPRRGGAEPEAATGAGAGLEGG